MLEMEQRWNVNFNKNLHLQMKESLREQKSYILFITSEHEHYCLLRATLTYILLLLQILKYQMCQSTAVPNKCITHCWNAFQKLQWICLFVNYFSNYEHINVYICILATYVKNTLVNNTWIIEIKSKIFAIVIVLLTRSTTSKVKTCNKILNDESGHFGAFSLDTCDLQVLSPWSHFFLLTSVLQKCYMFWYMLVTNLIM